MCGNCIYISFRKKRIDQLSVSKADQIFQFGNSLIRPAQKDAFRFGCRLDGKILSLQITQFIDITTRIYSNHLAACYVWSCPAVIIKTPFHGKAAHDTINFSALHQFFFLLPVNLDNVHLISHSFESFCSQFYIYTRRYTILIQIIVWWIVIAAERDDRLFGFFFTAVCVFTPCQGDRQNSHKQNACDPSFSFHFPSILTVILLFFSYQLLYHLSHFSDLRFGAPRHR